MLQQINSPLQELQIFQDSPLRINELLRRSSRASCSEQVHLEAKVQSINQTAHLKPLVDYSENIDQIPDQESKNNFIQNKKTIPKLKIFQLMNTNSYIKKFKNNIIMNSYIMPKDKKKFLSDKFIKQDNHIEDLAISKKGIPLFQSNSQFLFFWDIICILANFYILWITPFKASFQLNDDPTVIVLSFVMATLLAVDILINMNRTIILQGQEIQQRDCIIKSYLRDKAFFDLLSDLILFLDPSHFPSILKEISILLQMILTYLKLQHYFYNNFESSYLKGNLQSSSLDLLILIVQIYFYNHFTACVFHYAASETEYIGNTWLIKYEISDQSIWIKYNYAFYWATMTMTTVGYGDVTAQNYVEMICSTIIMFFSSCVFAYSMNSIGIILNNIYTSKIKYKLTLISINRFMKKNVVDFGIQNRIRNYIQFYVEQINRRNDEEVDQIINQLPSSLKDELLDDIRMKIINSLKVISHHFSKQTQIQLSKHLEPMQKFIPGDLVIQSGDVNNSNLYFISEGSIQLLENRTQMKLLKLEKGDMFGFYSFFTGQCPRVSAESINFTEIYSIKRDKFLEIIKSNRKDFETFHHIKDQIQLNNNFRTLDIRCSYCEKYTHIELDCPLISYKPDLEQRLKKMQFNELTNERKLFHRKKRTKSNSMFSLLRTVPTIKQYQDDMSENESFQMKQRRTYSSIVNLQDPDEMKEIKYQKSALKSQNSTFKLSDMTQEFEMVKNSFITDKVAQFKYYMPQNNIKPLTLNKESSNLNYALVKFNMYSFYYFVKLKAFQYRSRINQ